MKIMMLAICSILLLSGCKTTHQYSPPYASNYVGEEAGPHGTYGDTMMKGVSVDRNTRSRRDFYAYSYKPDYSRLGKTAYLHGSNFYEAYGDTDVPHAMQSYEEAITNRIDIPTKWMNPITENFGFTTPKKEGYVNGMFCRELLQRNHIFGRIKEQYSLVCQQYDGSWVVQ